MITFKETLRYFDSLQSDTKEQLQLIYNNLSKSNQECLLELLNLVHDDGICIGGMDSKQFSRAINRFTK
jgi:hypothetical protein